MHIGYLVHNLNDPAVERRCAMLERGGAKVKLAGFCRDAKLSDAIVRRQPFLLGRTQDSAMVQRILGTLRAAAFHGDLARYLGDCDALVARNLEQLGVARAVVGDRPLVYECLDIHHTLVGTGPLAKLVRAVEARLLPRVDLLWTSSMAFVDNHFAHTALDCPVELVENKLLVDSVEDFPNIPQPDPHGKIRIGWFGMLRCRKTLAVLTDLVAAMPDRLEVLIAGKPSPAVFTDFEGQTARAEGITYHGPYRYNDLPDLYGRCHFAWTIDWFEEGLNSSWLLPNRIYESLAHGSVPIALADIAVGRWLRLHDAGLLIANPDAIAAELARLTPEDIAAHQARVRAIPRRAVLADDRDCRGLVDTVKALARA
ncbi:MAG: glycosyltransferase family 4 protein [Erythrobacter sp.]|nr:glycosyltransferase family 4 protein [Erythrobacter sp.]